MRLAVRRANERRGRRAEAPLTSTAPQPPAEHPHARLAGRGARALLRLVGGVLAGWRSRRRRRAAIRELRDWNDGMLKDIGLTRGEIIAAVDGRLERGGPRPVAPVQGKAGACPGAGDRAMHRGCEPAARQPKARAGAIDQAESRAHVDRARELRAAFIAGLLRRAHGRLVRLLRRAVSAPLRDRIEEKTS
jgi:uncharacterized protein YjiS (DUF1127 family)